MKSKINDNLGLILVIIAVLSVFGFAISPAITKDQYEIDRLKREQQLYKISQDIEQLQKDIRKTHCKALRYYQAYLRVEQQKYLDTTELKIEQELYEALPTYHRAKVSLANVSNKLTDINNEIVSLGC